MAASRHKFQHPEGGPFFYAPGKCIGKRVHTGIAQPRIIVKGIAVQRLCALIVVYAVGSQPRGVGGDRMVCVFPQNSRLDILERDLAVTGKAFEVQTYQGIFVKKKVLFEGEIMEYRISELEDGKWVLKKEGSVSCDAA